MLNNSFYYHSLIRKYVVYFGSLFNDITIQRTDSNSNLLQTITVPISYGPKQKFIARLEQDPDATRQIAITLPRLSFEITDIQYNPSRKLNMQQKIVRANPVNSNETKYAYTPVAYDITFSLILYSKNAEDAFQILEQILPYFAPEWTSQIVLIPEMDIKMDVPVVLQSIRMTDRYDGPIENLRFIMHTVQFTMKAYLFGPVRNSGVIKRAFTNLIIDAAPPSSYTQLNIQANTDPAFFGGESVYIESNSSILATATVYQSTNSSVQLINVRGNFSLANTLLSTNSNNRATIITVDTITVPATTITTTPALLPNGQPTSNSQQSVNVNTIKPTDDYGIAIDISEN